MGSLLLDRQMPDASPTIDMPGVGSMPKAMYVRLMLNGNSNKLSTDRVKRVAGQQKAAFRKARTPTTLGDTLEENPALW